MCAVSRADSGRVLPADGFESPRPVQRAAATEGQRGFARSTQEATRAEEAGAIHHGECWGTGAGWLANVPFAPSERLGNGVWKLAGAELAEGSDGRALMMRPYGEDQKIYLHRALIDMRGMRRPMLCVLRLCVDCVDGNRIKQSW